MPWKKNKSDRMNPRKHTCKQCGVNFDDYSKNGRATCSPECNRVYSASVRKENGSYKWTAEQRRKLKVTQDKMRAEGRLTHSEETRKVLSQNLKKRWQDPKSREKLTANHWMKTDEGRAMASKLHKGKVVSAETRAKMSRSASERVKNKPESLFTRGTGGTREDLGQYFRSTWEANFARILNHQGKEWQYEPKTFELEEGFTYTPDFLVDGVYYEIKGWWDAKSVRKLLLFRQKYTTIEIMTVGEEEYKALLKEYKDKLDLE